MSIRGKLRDGATVYLQPGEQVQVAFLAKRRTAPYNDRAVVATDRRLLLLRLNFFGRPTALLGTSERHVRLGPCRGFMYRLPVFDSGLAVNKRFFSDVAEADRAAGF